MKAVFEIIEQWAGQRLDKFLSEQCGTPRAQVQKWIKNGGVMVNGAAMAVPHYILKKDDKVEAVSTIDTTGIISPRQVESGDDMTPVVRAVAEEPDYIVIEKPAGLLVHPNWIPGLPRIESGVARDDDRHTIADWLRQRYPECAAVGDKPAERPGIVHRLDKDASGLMVVARTQRMFEHLKQQFTQHEIYKEYLALAHDALPLEAGIIDFPIMRSTQDARMAARPVSQGGKEAITEYEVAQRYTNATLVRAMPKTGRTHQIRAHFFALGYPLIGDPLYFNKKDKRKLDAALGRLFLHATKLRFANLAGDTMEYESALPEKLKKFLETLKIKRCV